MAEDLISAKWQRAKEIFEAALGQPPERRSDFLTEACQGDAELRAEVENLLTGDARVNDNFLDAQATRSLFSRSPITQPLFRDQQVISQRFEILRFIGRGGMGEVYEARDLALGERVALKTIRSEVAADPHIMALFKREIQLARKVTHPNVCRIFDLVPHDAIILLSMELLEGETLSQRLERAGPMSTSEALPLVAQMAAGLGAAHQAGVVHGDFKSSNVMLVPAAGQEAGIRTVIMDFGLARRSNASDVAVSRPTAAGSMAGTPAYMAPEQVEGREITPATDIYALGVVMYEMVTGRRPFEGSNALAVAVKRLQEPPPSPRSHIPSLDSRWEQAILHCLERYPQDRFAGTDEIFQALQGTVLARVPGEQPRVLEAAAPKYAAVKRSMQLLAMIRRAESQGLKSFLEIEEITSLTGDDIRAKSFRLEFPMDRKGEPHEAEIALRVDSPDFEPRSQIKKLMVPPEQDSEVCTFLLTPQVEGELLLNLEVLKGEVLVASRAIKTVAKRTEQPRPLGPSVLVSIPLEVIAYGLRAAAGASLGQAQWASSAPEPPPSARAEWDEPRGALPSGPAAPPPQLPAPPPSSLPAEPSTSSPGEFAQMFLEKQAQNAPSPLESSLSAASPPPPQRPVRPEEFTRLFGMTREPAAPSHAGSAHPTAPAKEAVTATPLQLEALLGRASILPLPSVRPPELSQEAPTPDAPATRKSLTRPSLILGTTFAVLVILGICGARILLVHHEAPKSSAFAPVPGPAEQQLRKQLKVEKPAPPAAPARYDVRQQERVGIEGDLSKTGPMVTLLSQSPHAAGSTPVRNGKTDAVSSQPIAPNASPETEGQAVSNGKVDDGLKPINLHMPRVPGSRAGASVIFAIRIDAEGNVSPIRCLVDDNSLCRPAMAAAAAWKFKPPTVDGRPASTSISVKVTF